MSQPRHRRRKIYRVCWWSWQRCSRSKASLVYAHRTPRDQLQLRIRTHGNTMPHPHSKPQISSSMANNSLRKTRYSWSTSRRNSRNRNRARTNQSLPRRAHLFPRTPSFQSKANSLPLLLASCQSPRRGASLDSDRPRKELRMIKGRGKPSMRMRLAWCQREWATTPQLSSHSRCHHNQLRRQAAKPRRFTGLQTPPWST